MKLFLREKSVICTVHSPAICVTRKGIVCDILVYLFDLHQNHFVVHLLLHVHLPAI